MADILIIAIAVVVSVVAVIGLGLWAEGGAAPATKRVYDSYTKTWFDEDIKTGKRTLAAVAKEAPKAPEKKEAVKTVRVYDSYTKTWFDMDPATGKRTLAK